MNGRKTVASVSYTHLEVLGEVSVDPAILGPLSADVRPKAPGMKYKHYAPKADLTLVEPGTGTERESGAEPVTGAEQKTGAEQVTGAEQKSQKEQFQRLLKSSTVEALQSIIPVSYTHLVNRGWRNKSMMLPIDNTLPRSNSL